MSELSLLHAAADLGVPLQRLVTEVAALLDREFPGARGRLYVGDYRHEYLVPALGDGADLPVDDDAAGRCYLRQQPVVEQLNGAARAWLPVSAHGDRIGVLGVDMPAPVPPPADRDGAAVRHPDVARLQAVAGILARALRAGVGVTDDLLLVRRVRAMSVSAEMQWGLLPGSSFVDERITAAGQLEPAYAAVGDAYDWCRSTEDFVLAVFDAATGSAVDTALRTALAVNAFRNARRSSHDLAHVVCLTDEAVHDQSRGSWHIPATFVRLDTDTGRVEVVDAGSPAVLRRRGEDVRRLELDAQLPLGMFGGTPYQTEPVDVAPGDRLLIVTDGAHDAPHDRAITDADLADVTELLAGSRDAPVWQLTSAVIARVRRRHHDELPDDVVAVALDVR